MNTPRPPRDAPSLCSSPGDLGRGRDILIDSPGETTSGSEDQAALPLLGEAIGRAVRVAAAMSHGRLGPAAIIGW